MGVVGGSAISGAERQKVGFIIDVWMCVHVRVNRTAVVLTRRVGFVGGSAVAAAESQKAGEPAQGRTDSQNE